ncbi:MAG TPA: hypothetical protein PKH77_13485 [Anaerolineae bacterium]|nr:hypothetical protein [Anaerolineae bacterium]
MAPNYCTIGDIRDLTDDPDVGAGLLTLIIPAVSRGIDRHCHRQFYSITAARLHDYNSEEPGLIRLKDDLLSLSSLTTTGGDEFDSTDFLFEPDRPPYGRLILKPGRSLTYLDTYKQAITITGSWGYSDLPPDEVTLVAKLWTLALYRQVDLIGIDSARIAGVSVQLPKLTAKMLPELSDWLKPFVRHSIGAI